MTMTLCTKRDPYRNGFEWPAQKPNLNPIQHLWDELERRLRARAYCPKSVANVTCGRVAGREQIPADRLQTIVENLPRGVAVHII